MKKKIAKIISFVGNPLVLSVLAAVYANFQRFEVRQALILTGILLLVGVGPVFWYINRRVNAGQYADHDVSARTKRPSLYLFAMGILAVLIAVLYFTHQPRHVISGAVAAWLLAAASFLVNFKTKTSLHTGYAFLIGFLTLSVSFSAGMGLIGFAFLVGWSRVALGRHTLQEVFIGASLGATIGCLFYQTMLV
ncbi:MAG: phosphatase PAP2 family protein [Spirosomaceae bacterium]|jgi:membrane-associated phospholipid phosphatase|nr:phosphatase PAP2 family protein [Spirosomataceae bacterium]